MDTSDNPATSLVGEVEFPGHVVDLAVAGK